MDTLLYTITLNSFEAALAFQLGLKRYYHNTAYNKRNGSDGLTPLLQYHLDNAGAVIAAGKLFGLYPDLNIEDRRRGDFAIRRNWWLGIRNARKPDGQLALPMDAAKTGTRCDIYALMTGGIDADPNHEGRPKWNAQRVEYRYAGCCLGDTLVLENREKIGKNTYGYRMPQERLRTLAEMVKILARSAG